VLCVMADHLQPAICNLLAAASYRPGTTDPAVTALLEAFFQTFAEPEPQECGQPTPRPLCPTGCADQQG
jgi:hypothetical protein